MLRKITIALLLSVTAFPAFALTDQSSHYETASPQAQVTDPDEQDNFQSGANGGVYAPSGRQQQLLGGSNNGQQTYGFGSPDGSLSYGIGQSNNYGFR